MKKAEYQLVLQFPCTSMAEFDAVIELEGKLIDAFADSATEVDGHDSGSGEANIFILTSDPNTSFASALAVIMKDPGLAASLRAGFRPLDADEYSVLWPTGVTAFSVA
jgi:hypothetical protein